MSMIWKSDVWKFATVGFKIEADTSIFTSLQYARSSLVHSLGLQPTQRVALVNTKV